MGNKAELKNSDSSEQPWDNKLVPNSHRFLFSKMKKSEKSESDEDSKNKKPIKYEPQAIRPTTNTKNPSFLGFKNMLDNNEYPKLSDPKNSLLGLSNTPRFLLNESDPQGFARNISHSFLFQNTEFTPGSGRNVMNTSNPNDFNFENFGMAYPNMSNYANNMMNSQFDRTNLNEKEKNAQIDLSIHPVASGPLLGDNSVKEINLDTQYGPVKLNVRKGNKITIEVADNNKLIISQQFPMQAENRNNTSLSKDAVMNIEVSSLAGSSKPAQKAMPGISDTLLSKSSANCVDNKFWSYISKYGSSSGKNSHKEDADTFSLSKVQKQPNSSGVNEKKQDFKPEFRFGRNPMLWPPNKVPEEHGQKANSSPVFPLEGLFKKENKS